MSLDVRPMLAGDHERILAIAREELAPWFRPLDQIALAIDLRQHEGFVATRGGEVGGFLTFHVPHANAAELSWLGVSPAMQEQGMAAALLAAMEAELLARGVREVRVSTVDESSGEPAFDRTRRFYLRRGFVPVRCDRNHFAPGRHRLLLSKQL